MFTEAEKEEYCFSLGRWVNFSEYLHFTKPTSLMKQLQPKKHLTMYILLTPISAVFVGTTSPMALEVWD